MDPSVARAGVELVARIGDLNPELGRMVHHTNRVKKVLVAMATADRGSEGKKCDKLIAISAVSPDNYGHGRYRCLKGILGRDYNVITQQCFFFSPQLIYGHLCQ